MKRRKLLSKNFNPSTNNCVPGTLSVFPVGAPCWRRMEDRRISARQQELQRNVPTSDRTICWKLQSVGSLRTSRYYWLLI